MGRIQQFTPVGRSLAWDLLERFYEDQGPQAWTKGIVPQEVTSNCYTADTYAGLVAAFFRDLMEEGNSEPPIVLELGGGTGRFAWQFLNRLFNYHFVDGEECPQFTYLLTDAAKRNVASWAGKSRFGPLVESGVLEFAQMRVEKNPIVRTSQGDLRPEDLANRPLIIIANFLFDSVPSNLLRVRDHRLEQVSMSLISSEADFLKRDLSSFSTVTEQFRSKPLKKQPSKNAVLNGIIQSYVEEAEDGDDFHIVVPEIGFSFLQKFLDRNTPMMLISGGPGYASSEDFDLKSPFIFEDHFAHRTNYDLFRRLFAVSGGSSQFQRHLDSSFCSGAFFLPGKGEWEAISLEGCKREARGLLREFSPLDAHELNELVEIGIEEPSCRQVEAWLRFSKCDPAIAELALPPLLKEIEQGDSPFQPDQLYELFMEAYRAYLPDGTHFPFDCGIAHLFMRLGFVEQAADLMAQSIAEFGPTARRLFVHALALTRLGRMDEAQELAHMSLEMDGSFAPTQRLIADKFAPQEEDEAEADAAAVDVAYPHLRVGFSDPDVISKSRVILEDKGAVLIDQIISPELVEELREDFQQQVRNWQTSGLGKPNNVGDKRFTVPIRIRAPFDDPAIYANPALTGLLRNMFGQKPALHAFGGVVTHEGARMQHVHREHPMLFNSDAANAAAPLYAVNVLVPLVDLDEESGGTQFWEGTHKYPEDKEWEGESEVVYTPAGSALVLDYRTYHGGMPCRATHGRPVLFYTYCMPWFTDTLAFDSHAALGLTDAERMNIPEHHRHLFKFSKRIVD